MDIDQTARGMELPAEALLGMLPCGHEGGGTVIQIEVGERREGEDWKVLRREFQVRCNQCAATSQRFWFTEA